MERIVRGRSATLTKTFTFTPTGTPSVVLVRVSTGAAVTTGSVTGSGTTWTYTIPASSNTLLDTYRETWTAVTGGEPQAFDDDEIEVAGGTLFTLAEARAAGIASPKFTDADVVEMRTTVEQEIEQACGCAFVPRYALETVDGSGGYTILLRPHTTLIRSATLGSTPVSPETISGFTYSTTGVVSSSTLRWSSAYSTVGYEHGMLQTPLGIKRAALILAKTWLVGRQSPVDDRATTFGAENGISYSLAVAGRGGSHFGIPDVDAAVDRYSLATLVA